MARRFGVSEEQIAAVADFRTHGGFTTREQSMLALAEAMTRSGGQVTDAVWAEASAHFTAAELVELVGVIAAFNAFNRMANALQVDITTGS